MNYHLTVKHFDYAILMRDHLSLFFYSALVFISLSFYFVKDGFARAGFFIMVMGTGIYIQRLEWSSLLFIGALATFIYYGQNAIKPLLRGVLFLLGLIASVFAIFYPIPGIINWQVVKAFQFSYKAIPYGVSLSIPSFLTALFFLWFSNASLMNEGNWEETIKKSLIIALLGAIVWSAAAYYMGVVTIDIKPTNFYFLWGFHYLFFVCAAQEVIFRGMIQNFLMLRLQIIQGGKWLALGLAAVIFSLLYYQAGWIQMGLAIILGLFSGYAYLRTRKIEASILVHFFISSTHFLLLSYPALRG